MRVLLSAFFWGYLALSLMAFWFAVVPVWLVLAPFDRRRRFSHWYAWTWANHYVFLSPFWNVVVEGREHIEDGRTYVLVANHQSLADIFVLYGLKKHFKWVSKDSIFRVPFLGWMMSMADYVPIRRGDSESRRAMMDRCQHHLSRGSSIMIFPEGTRSRDGAMRSFRLGAFRMAVDANVDVVPVVIDGTLEALPRDSWVFRHGGVLDVRVRALAPVPVASCDGDPRVLCDTVHRIMAAELDRMRANSSSD